MATRRAAAPSSLTLQPKSTISVEEWEARAPLDDIQARSVNWVKAASKNVSLPLKFSVDDSSSSSRPSSPAFRNKLLGVSVSRPGTPNLPVTHPLARSQAANALHPQHPIQTPQQFYDWFSLIDRSVTHSQEAHFREHLARVATQLDTCDKLIQYIDNLDEEVDGMLTGWRSVEESGKSLKDACEQLLDERDQLLETTEAIGARLEYFQELEHAARMLNHPGESLVLQTDFLYMVERVGICIDYLKSHRNFREAEVYLLRFQQCMTRAMTLIRMFFVGSLRALVTDVTKRISERDVSTTAQAHLLYTRFKTVSGQLAPLLSELERRAAAHPDELSSLLTECHWAYFAARKGLLVPRLTEEIKGLDPTRTELVELTREGCSYLKQLCTEEFDLFRAFFNSGEEQLYQYLENLCDYLYDDLRPRILHEPRLTALCEVCTVLQALMVLDVPDYGDEDDEELNLNLDKPGHKGLRSLHISHLLQMVLQDAQTRLFFKAQSVIQSEVRYFTPRPEDLAYPDKLVAAAHKVASEFEIKEKESISQLFHFKSLDKQETWYPTLRKTVWVLSQLHDFVKPAIFDDIAEEAANLCRQSLFAASDMLRTKNPPASVLDGQLFHVRHLLILKEMTQNLDFASKNPEKRADMTSVTDTLTSMLNKTTTLFPSMLASLGMPADDLPGDVRRGIDLDLKRACEEVINSCADSVCKPIRSWLERVAAHNVLPRKEPLSSQPWASEAAVVALITGFKEACQRDLHSIAMRLRLYLEDGRTVAVLLKHAQEKISDEYLDFRMVVSGEYGNVLKGQVGSEESVRNLLNDVCNTGAPPEAGGSGSS